MISKTPYSHFLLTVFSQCKSRYNRICGIGLTPSIGHCRDTLLLQKNLYGLYGVKIVYNLNTARGCNEVSLLESVDYNTVATVVILKTYVLIFNDSS